MKTKKTLLLFIATFLIISLYAQNEFDKKKITSDLGFDFTNRYLWRGTILNASSNLQPYWSFEYKGFTTGAWGYYATNGQYGEFDLFLAFTFQNLNTTQTDYYIENENNISQLDNFNYKDDVTAHALELMVGYNFDDFLPLTLTVFTNVYGNDKIPNGDNFFSTFFQANYALEFDNFIVDYFVDAIPTKSIYDTQVGNIAEINLRVSRKLEISEKCSLPFSVAVVTNPADENLHMIQSIGIN